MGWQRIIRWVTTPYRKFKEKQILKERIKQLRKQDPFIYK